ncbi:hypothetical protein DFH28DRAFT_1082165 [Melampsora americana]|nr:hypothetical protein DFH28DRAFT_1082165 [Melampsora americana]
MPKLPKDQKHISNKKPKQDPTKSNRHHIPHDRAVNLLQSLGYSIGTAQPAEASRDDKVGTDHGNDHDLNYNPQDDPPIPLLDSAAKSLAQAARAQFYAQKQLEFEHQWINLVAPVTAVFLERQHATQNWTTSFSYLANQPECICNHHNSQISSYQFTFCKCWPNVIRLLYAGYFASSPTKPHTAFAIPLVQFHHRLWQTSALSTSAFIDALVAFLDNQSASPLYGRLWNGKTTKRELRKPLTQSIDLYRQILCHQELLYIEGLDSSSLDIYTQKCAFAELVKKTSAKGSDMKWSVVSFNISLSRLLTCTTPTAQWLLSKLNNALQVKDNSSKGLSDLYSQHNPHDHDQEFYSAKFLKEQWTLERNAHASKKQAKEKQQLELGRLLCLEEEIRELWNTPVNTLAAEHKLSRTRRLNETQEKITAQQKKVGAKPVVAFMSCPEHDGLLMVWRIAILKEKIPPNQSQAQGRNSNLGVTGNTTVLTAIQKHAVALTKAVDQYQEQLNVFRTKFPNRPAYPPDINYATIFNIQADDPFWSEGLFTNHKNPWAIDPKTQYGMRQLSYFDWSQDKIRRIGWEVWREM